MKKITVAAALIIALCLLTLLTASAQTRQGTIWLEGTEEPISETRFISPQGFSFWYAEEHLEVYNTVEGNIDGTHVGGMYSDDSMILDMITEEDAEEYTEDFDETIVELAADRRVVMDIYRELENGRYYFLTLVAENGQYLRAVGEYSEEAAEGNAKYFDRVLDSVAFTDEAPTGDPVPRGDDDPQDSGYEAYERSILLEGRYYTLGESTVAEIADSGWSYTQAKDGRFVFLVDGEEDNCIYARTDNGKPEGRLIMLDLFYAYGVAYEYLGFGFDMALDPDAEEDIYSHLEEYYDGDYDDEGVLYARTPVRGGTLLIEVSESALRLTLE